jgi:hypothetical protein
VTDLTLPSDLNVGGNLDVTGNLTVTGSTPAPNAHASSHQNGGADEISVEGLSGDLADPQDPKTHASTHESGGSDEIDLTGLSGLPDGPTKQVFVPVTSTTGTMSNVGQFAAADLGGSEEAYITFPVPHDFSSITDAVVVVVPQSTDASTYIYRTVDYGAIGEDYNNHQATTSGNLSFTANKLTEIDISGLLGSLAAGDLVGVEIKTGASESLYVLGVRFRYS